MNYDRFLTRVWDKQAKKMLYSINEDYIALDNEGIIDAFYHSEHWDGKEETKYFEFDINKFGDRFVPMMCSGFREDNRDDGHLIYEFDFIKTYLGLIFLVKLKDGCWVGESLAGEGYCCDLASLQNRVSVYSNRWEQPELLEVKA
jgi:hypothetical protein